MMLVGEAPGKEEDQTGLPFKGHAGATLDRLLVQSKISRQECLIANVAREKPPGNNISYYFKDKKCTIPRPNLIEWIELLKRELQMYKPNIVVALGATALWALTGFKGIKTYRGAVIESSLVPGQKVLPTYHPQAVSYEPSLAFTTIMDLRKALYHQGFAYFPKDNRILVDKPSKETWIDFCKLLLEDLGDPIGVDIETARGAPGCHITRLAIAASNETGISLPILSGDAPAFPERDELELWRWTGKVLTEKPLVFHNASFDASVLWMNHGIFCFNNIYMDTIIAAHCCWPELESNLGYLASILLDVPAWKHDKSYHGLYNAADAVNTLALVLPLKQYMRTLDVEDIVDRVTAEIEPASILQLQGLSVDMELKDKLVTQGKLNLEQLEQKLYKTIGREINYNSPDQIKNLLYIELDLPPQFKRRKSIHEERKLTTDEDALNKLDRITNNPALKLILQCRKQAKSLSNFLDIKTSPKNKVHTSYNITGAATGRWSSSQSIIHPFGPGNLQNIPEASRSLYVAKEGYSIVRGDYVQAEAVVTVFLCLDTVLMKMFRESFGMSPSQRKKSHDIHKYTASIMYEIPMEAVAATQRRVGKTIRHALNYSAGPKVLAAELSISAAQAKKLIKLFFSKNHLLTAWHMRIQRQLQQDKTLITPMKRKRRFLSRWGDDLFRSAYAYIPQSTIGDLLNFALAEFYFKYGDKYSLYCQLHDALYIEVEDSLIDQAIRDMRKVMLKEIVIGQEPVTIDVDFAVGKSWGEMKELDIDWRNENETIKGIK